MKILLAFILLLASIAEAQPQCDMNKLPFGKAEACSPESSDGSVEFCLPLNKPQAEQQIKTQFPNVGCFDGYRSGGRIGCDTRTEVLCLYKILPIDCNRKAITSAGWAKLCELSQLDLIKKIAPTWAE